MTKKREWCPYCLSWTSSPSRKVTLAQAVENHRKTCPGLHRASQPTKKGAK